MHPTLSFSFSLSLLRLPTTIYDFFYVSTLYRSALSHICSANTAIVPYIMSFSSLVQDLSFRDANDARRNPRPPMSTASTIDDRRSHVSRAMSYASTAATSVSISGDISSQLHGGYSHPLARSWQAERQLTKVSRNIIRSLVRPAANSTLSQCSSILSSSPTSQMRRLPFPPSQTSTAAGSTRSDRKSVV